jgi:hypothetical protein
VPGLDYFATMGPAPGTGSLSTSKPSASSRLYENNKETSRIQIDRILSDFIAETRAQTIQCGLSLHGLAGPI